jgi:uncharacterized protein YecE (DUF72 family)
VETKQIPHIHIGPAGWSYPDWEGIVYPATKSRSFDPLRYLASYFDLIEINSTFYRTPSRSTCRRWVARVEEKPEFVFTAKAPQEMTHHSQPASQSDVAAFKTAIEPLFESHRLGALLIQFPWSFRASPAATAYVRTLTDWFRPFPTAVEVRHGTWGTPRGLSFFRQTGITLCGIDQPVIGDSLAPGTYVPGAGRAYFRLHGRNNEKWFSREAGRNERYNYLYGVSELTGWRDTVRAAGTRVENVYVVLNNHFRGQAVVNALQLRAMLTGRRSTAPGSLVSSFPGTDDLLEAQNGAGAPSRSGGEKQLDLFGEDKNGKHGDDAKEED